jgi:hypothetical protein
VPNRQTRDNPGQERNQRKHLRSTTPAALLRCGRLIEQIDALENRMEWPALRCGRGAKVVDGGCVVIVSGGATIGFVDVSDWPTCMRLALYAASERGIKSEGRVGFRVFALGTMRYVNIYRGSSLSLTALGEMTSGLALVGPARLCRLIEVREK